LIRFFAADLSMKHLMKQKAIQMEQGLTNTSKNKQENLQKDRDVQMFQAKAETLVYYTVVWSVESLAVCHLWLQVITLPFERKRFWVVSTSWVTNPGFKSDQTCSTIMELSDTWMPFTF
jgi:hypothetical protein